MLAERFRYPSLPGAVDVVLRWCDSREERVRTFASSWPTPEGGAHSEGFRGAVLAAVDA